MNNLLLYLCGGDKTPDRASAIAKRRVRGIKERRGELWGGDHVMIGFLEINGNSWDLAPVH
jgi:hypothetical protein